MTPMPVFPETLVPVEPAREPATALTVPATERQREWAAERFAKRIAEFEVLTEAGSGRNAMVNSIAMWAGGAAAHGMLDRETVEDALLAAAEANGHATTNAARRAVIKTIDNGWKAGLAKPISDFPRELDLSDLEDLEDLEDLPDLPESPEGDPEPAANWESLLDRNAEGGVISTLPNVQLIVANDPRLVGRVGFNELEQCTVFMREPGRLMKKARDGKPIRGLDGPLWTINNRGERVSGRRWIDAHTGALRIVIESPKSQGGYGIKVSDRDINTAIEFVARQNTFHPVRDYLCGLTHDDMSMAEMIELIETVFISYLGTDDTPYHRQASRLFCLGAVTRAFEPGHKFDFVPILEGAQGLRKSTFIGALSKSWGGELSCDFHDNKSVVESLQGGWIYEIPELQGFSKADTTTLKAVISRPVDRARLSYGRLVQEFPRQCVFVGSTNEDEYLRDVTGGRRFWPIRCKVSEIDTDLLIRNIDRIWAAAVSIYREMRRLQPKGDLPLYIDNPGAASEAKQLQETRRSETPEELLAAEMRAVLDEPEVTDLDGVGTERTETCIKELWVDLLGRDPRDLSNQMTTRLIGRAIRLAGWSPGGQVRFKKYGSQKSYTRT